MKKPTVWHACGTRPTGTRQTGLIRTPKNAADQPRSKRADDGNRTRMTSLEGYGHGAAELRLCRPGGVPRCP